MGSGPDAWRAYFYPETFDPATNEGTLRNLFDERDRFVLQRLEYGATRARQGQLRMGDVDVPRTFDAAHLRAIHRYVFQDVYAWAGEYRTVSIAKGTPRGFADVKTGEVDRYLRDVTAMVTSTQWGRLDHEQFAQRAATVFAYINQAHPFREGNGRSSKVFMEHVAELSRFELDYSRVTPEQWNEASKWSAPDLFAYEPHADELVPVFRAIAVERTPSASTAAEGPHRDLGTLRASYPQSATKATRPGQSTPAAARYGGPTRPGRGPESTRGEQGR
ncbi:cell filamentation protein Fic (plasmid) [Xylanimonas allomyrinae]|uniref:protein adenylyltransferase n=1 Tax=Xylanimonas allomyrinae TaxID=2509459 RepID=A0A4P6ETN7_9MICO|nr:Fic family protein [Xylanimonas allomyrinae]QAY64999.1 cell filamentation protein Fic [Xylanimonas allomyrinae]